MFTSPHLVRIEERVRLDGQPIASEQFDAFLSMIQEAESVLNEALTSLKSRFSLHVFVQRETTLTFSSSKQDLVGVLMQHEFFKRTSAS